MRLPIAVPALSSNLNEEARFIRRCWAGTGPSFYGALWPACNNSPWPGDDLGLCEEHREELLG